MEKLGEYQPGHFEEITIMQINNPKKLSFPGPERIFPAQFLPKDLHFQIQLIHQKVFFISFHTKYSKSILVNFLFIHT